MGVLLVVTALLFDLFALEGAPSGKDANGEATGWLVVCFSVALLISFSVLWRHQWPWLVLALQALGVAVFSTSGMGAVFVLPAIIVRQSPKRNSLRIAAGITATCTIIAIGILREFHKPKQDRMFAMHDPVTGSYSEQAWWGYLIAAIVVIALAVAWGMIRRFRLLSAHAQAVASAERAHAQELRGEVCRQQERELIASEMHDTVAHQLSLVSLHAAALQVTTSDPEASTSARAIRGLGHQALEEMRTLISSLRDSESSRYTGASPTLEHLPELIHEAQEAGVNLLAKLEISGVEHASDGLTRAVYRITQEALTNAIKYGTGEWVGLTVVARVGEPVVIEVLNPMTPESSTRAVHGSMGAGIPGMEQRALTLGGTLVAELRSLAVLPKSAALPGSGEVHTLGDVWVVRAVLPWGGND